MDFSESMKKLILAGIGAVAITADKSKEMIDELVKKGELTVEQGKVLNEELKHKAQSKVSETLVDNVENLSEEGRQALRKKLDELDHKGKKDK